MCYTTMNMIIVILILITVISVLIFRAPLIPCGQLGVTNLEIVCVKGLFSVHIHKHIHTRIETHTRIYTHKHTHKNTQKD